MTINTKAKAGLLLVMLYGGYLLYLLISTWNIDTTVIPPENCRRLKSLPSIDYSDFQFFAVLKQKRKVKALGGDTLYLPPSLRAANLKEGRLSGVAFRCDLE